MTPMGAIIDLTFPHRWRAEILPARPLILPPRHFTYPAQAEEVERGALEVLIHPQKLDAGRSTSKDEADAPVGSPLLATCALGFRDAAVPSGIWSTPCTEEICALSGGYAYIIDTTAPEKFTMLSYRPVLQVQPVIEMELLVFVGHRGILAWSAMGQAWESEKLSDEGLTIVSIEKGQLRGTGWNMLTDEEHPFALDLRTGAKVG